MDLGFIVCKHTDSVHLSGVGFREGGVYSTIISTAVGTVDYVQQYRSGTGIAVYLRYKIASLLKGNKWWATVMHTYVFLDVPTPRMLENLGKRRSSAFATQIQVLCWRYHLVFIQQCLSALQ